MYIKDKRCKVCFQCEISEKALINGGFHKIRMNCSSHKSSGRELFSGVAGRVGPVTRGGTTRLAPLKRKCIVFD